MLFLCKSHGRTCAPGGHAPASNPPTPTQTRKLSRRSPCESWEAVPRRVQCARRLEFNLAEWGATKAGGGAVHRAAAGRLTGRPFVRNSVFSFLLLLPTAATSRCERDIGWERSLQTSLWHQKERGQAAHHQRPTPSEVAGKEGWGRNLPRPCVADQRVFLKPLSRCRDNDIGSWTMRKGLCRSADVWNRKSQHGFLLWLELSDSVLFESNYVGEYKAVNTLSPHNIQNKTVFTERLGNDSGGVQYFSSSKKY